MLTIRLCVGSVAYVGRSVEMDESREDSYLAGSRADRKVERDLEPEWERSGYCFEESCVGPRAAEKGRVVRSLECLSTTRWRSSCRPSRNKKILWSSSWRPFGRN